jgi:hypothetical protein
MACYDNLVTVRNLCDSATNTLFYLDDLGISLKGAAAVADERNVTGRQLIERKIAQAWEQVYSDISFDGYKAGSIVWGANVGENTTGYEATGGGYKGMTFTIEDNCPLAMFYLHKVTLCYEESSPDLLQIRLIDGDTEFLFNATHTGGSKEVLVNRWITNQEFQIQVNTDDIAVCAGVLTTGDCQPCKTSYVTVQSDEGKNWGLQVEVSLMCKPDRHLCKYNGFLAKAAWYKAAALIYKEFLMSTRINDYLTIKSGENNQEVLTQMAWLDSDVNLFNFDAEGRKSYPDGMYQKEMAKIKVPLPSCMCCLECRGNSYNLSIP